VFHCQKKMSKIGSKKENLSHKWTVSRSKATFLEDIYQSLPLCRAHGREAARHELVSGLISYVQPEVARLTLCRPPQLRLVSLQYRYHYSTGITGSPLYFKRVSTLLPRSPTPSHQTEEFHRVYWCINWSLLLRIQTRTQRFTKKGTSRCSIDKDSPVTSPELSVATPVHVCVCVCVLVCVCMCACVCVCVCVCYVRLSYACHHISWESINAGTPPPQNITCSST
jgi:hypothetical protein